MFRLVGVSGNLRNILVIHLEWVEFLIYCEIGLLGDNILIELCGDLFVFLGIYFGFLCWGNWIGIFLGKGIFDANILNLFSFEFVLSFRVYNIIGFCFFLFEFKFVLEIYKYIIVFILFFLFF